MNKDRSILGPFLEKPPRNPSTLRRPYRYVQPSSSTGCAATCSGKLLHRIFRMIYVYINMYSYIQIRMHFAYIQGLRAPFEALDRLGRQVVLLVLYSGWFKG